MDAKDILGLPKNSFPSSQEKKPRPPKESQRKPDGVSREVYALTGGNLPSLMPTVDISHFKRRPINLDTKEKITWQWLTFSNSARTDNLQLCHWVRIVNGVAPTDDYSFAKYNKAVKKHAQTCITLLAEDIFLALLFFFFIGVMQAVDILKYTDEEYEKHLADPVDVDPRGDRSVV